MNITSKSRSKLCSITWVATRIAFVGRFGLWDFPSGPFPYRSNTLVSISCRRPKGKRAWNNSTLTSVPANSAFNFRNVSWASP
ncbi:MAG: hypothetical protein M0T83_01270, partial [Nitrospiraceae bacterium]|nr:hypothetical protein [Nitrospiraceae bacterium]